MRDHIARVRVARDWEENYMKGAIFIGTSCRVPAVPSTECPYLRYCPFDCRKAPSMYSLHERLIISTKPRATYQY